MRLGLFSREVVLLQHLCKKQELGYLRFKTLLLEIKEISEFFLITGIRLLHLLHCLDPLFALL